MRLRVSAVAVLPSRGASSSDEQTALAEAVLTRSLELGTVLVAPDRPVLARRARCLGGDSGERLRLMSYNLMAQTYSRNWNEPGGIHSYCAPELTSPASRLPRQYEEVAALAPDVLAMQEVDASTYHSFWKPQLEADGFEGSFSLKRGTSSSEGCAIFVRRAKLQLQATRTVPLDLAEDAPPALRPLLDAHPATAAGMAALPSVALMAMARVEGGGRLLLVNTHLYFANPAVHVRLMQTAALLDHAHRWAAQADGETELPPLVVLGDLNSDSTDAAYALLTEGQVGASHGDWLSGHLSWSPSLELEESARAVAASALRRRGLVADDAASEAGGGTSGEGGTPTEGGGDGDGAAGDGVPRVADARAAARRFHRLRRAARTLLQQRWLAIPDSATATTASAGDSSSAADAGDGSSDVEGEVMAQAVKDLARGKTLVTSAPLAALEVYEACGVSVAELSGPEAAVSVQARLTELATALEAQTGALRDQAERSPHEATATTHAGVALVSPWGALQSAYGANTVPTHALRGYQNALDWICFDGRQLQLSSVAPLPTRDELLAHTAMPSVEFPSDHVSLCAEVRWRSEEAA